MEKFHWKELSEMETEHITVTASPELLKLMSRTLYSMDHPTIWVREIGLQNAVDAAKAAGREPKIRIKIERVEDTLFMEVQDNGCGMDIPTLRDAYFCLGATAKGELDDSGGFGVAAAVELSGNDWSVRTNDLYYTRAMMEKGKPVEQVELQKGTTVTCVTDSFDKWSWEDQIIRLIYSSEVDIHLILIGGDGTILLDDPHAGTGRFPKLSRTPLLATENGKDENGNLWEASGSQKMTAPLSNSLTGYAFFRLNGLTQFWKYSSVRTTVLWFDITAKNRPGEDYPFTMPRESLQGSMKDFLTKVLERHTIDHKTSERHIVSPHKPSKEVRAGAFLRSKRHHEGRLYNNDPDLQNFGIELDKDEIIEQVKEMMEQFPKHNQDKASEVIHRKIIDNPETEEPENIPDAPPTTLDGLAQVLVHAPAKQVETIRDELVDALTEYMIFLDCYDTDNQAELAFDAEVLDLWKELMWITAEPEEIFGVGLVHKYGVTATRGYEMNTPVYQLNPEVFRRIMPGTAMGVILTMWSMACHEAAHFRSSTHDEAFSDAEFIANCESAHLLELNWKLLIQIAKKIVRLEKKIV